MPPVGGSWQKPVPVSASVKFEGEPAVRDEGLNELMTGCPKAEPDVRAPKTATVTNEREINRLTIVSNLDDANMKIDKRDPPYGRPKD